MCEKIFLPVARIFSSFYFSSLVSTSSRNSLTSSSSYHGTNLSPRKNSNYSSEPLKIEITRSLLFLLYLNLFQYLRKTLILIGYSLINSSLCPRYYSLFLYCSSLSITFPSASYSSSISPSSIYSGLPSPSSAYLIIFSSSSSSYRLISCGGFS